MKELSDESVKHGSGSAGHEVVVDVDIEAIQELFEKGFTKEELGAYGERLECDLAHCAAEVLLHLSVSPVELSIMVVTQNEIRELNGKWRNLHRATDVLSFPQMTSEELEQIIFSSGCECDDDECVNGEPLPPMLLGDVVISPAVVHRRAGSKDAFYEDMEKVLIHGLLHLIGLNHKKALDRKKMREKESELYSLLRSQGKMD